MKSISTSSLMELETPKTKTSEPVWFSESTKNEEALICREGKGIRNRKQTETKKYMKGISFRFLGIAFFWLVLHEVGWESITEREQAGFVEKKNLTH